MKILLKKKKNDQFQFVEKKIRPEDNTHKSSPLAISLFHTNFPSNLDQVHISDQRRIELLDCADRCAVLPCNGRERITGTHGVIDHLRLAMGPHQLIYSGLNSVIAVSSGTNIRIILLLLS